jgi:cytidylate kinase
VENATEIWVDVERPKEATKMKRKINVAIDGYSSCGKSTLAKQLAAQFKFIYIDSGAMYRAVTLFAIENGIVGKEELNEDELIYELKNINISFTFNSRTGVSETYLNGRNVESKIRTLEVARWVSPIAAIKEVRVKLVKFQQQLAKNKGVVMDGRDIGTAVIPDAELKVFMTATTEVRAQRRYKELTDRGDKITLEEVKQSLARRDDIDTTRKESPLTRAEDAIILDNTILTLDEQLDIVQDWVVERLIRK